MQEVAFFSFRQQMKQYFSDFPQLIAKIDRNAFTRRDLDKIVAEYNTWKGRGW